MTLYKAMFCGYGIDRALCYLLVGFFFSDFAGATCAVRFLVYFFSTRIVLVKECAQNWIMNTSKIIQQQLMQYNEIESWGVTEWVELSDNTLGIRVHARYLNGVVCVSLDKERGLYIIEFCSNKSFRDFFKDPEIKYMVEGLYKEQLFEFIDQTIDKIPD